jgi:hypothetical protein
MEEEDLKILKYYINSIIRDGGTKDPKSDMLKLADYYQYLSSCIQPDEYFIDADKELILNFEALYLWLHERTSILSSSIKEQIENIFKDKNLCEIFAILTSISPKDIRRINRNRSLGAFGNIFAAKLSVDLNDKQAELVTSRNILDTKVALVRLAQVVRFSASKINDYSMGSSNFEDFKSSYNPDLINKVKVSALVGVLKSQISDLPQDENTELLLEKLESIEIEIKKSKPHWGLIFSTLFVIFGFTADLKTLSPDIYEKPLQTIETILFTVHEEGKVETSRKTASLLSAPDEKKPNLSEKVLLRSREKGEFVDAET